MNRPRQSAPASAVSSGTRKRLVLVVGTGRSGTSTVAGALARLGLHVPQPEVPADETNPRGFYEPQWAVDFHKGLLARVPARNNDARPDAAALVREVWDQPLVRQRLRSWLTEEASRLEPRGQLVVKDPRTIWFLELWQEVAEEVDLEPCFLTMLRHPTKVARSRDTNYLTDRDEHFRRKRLTGSVASWVNGTVATESATRAHPRAFVPYDDLLADWRGALGPAAAHLCLDLSPPLEQSPHPVDEFIEPALNRSRVTWEDVRIPDELRTLADRAWEACGLLVTAPADAGAATTMDEIGRGYARLHEWAEAITNDLTSTRVQAARREVRQRFAGEPAGKSERHEPAPSAGPRGRLARRARRAGGRTIRGVRRLGRAIGDHRHRR